MTNIVAIIGKPNVGKSTLFNRLLGHKRAIVDEVSGVTRDRHYGKTEWGGREFTIIDTGGYIQSSEDVFDVEIRRQVEIAIKEANLLLFVVDVMLGISDLDAEVAQLVRKSGRKCILIANKVDNNMRIAQAAEFYKLGLGEVHSISAINGSGTGDLMDEVVASLPKETISEKKEIGSDGEEIDTENPSESIPRIAVVGRPNAGKSSLLNALVGVNRNIVTPIAGTTRDSVDTYYKAFGFELILVDTAGIRKKGKVHEDLEFYSVLRAIRAIENADVCLLMIDAKEGIGVQDLNIFHLIEKNKKGVVILINKWDLIEKDTHTAKQFIDTLKERLAPFNDVPIITTSATEKLRIHKTLEKAMEVYNNRLTRIKTKELNDTMLQVIERNPPPAIKGKYVKIKYVTQLPTHAPTFAFFCNLPQYVKESYRRFLENKMREAYKFEGVPLTLFFRKK